MGYLFWDMISNHILILKRYPLISEHILSYPIISQHIPTYPRGRTPRWARWCVPKYARDRKRVWIHRVHGRRGRGREAEQVLMERHALFEAPFPDRRKGGRAMNE
jgi:hypothetical protein